VRRDCRQFKEQHNTSASVCFAANVASAVSTTSEATADWLLDTGASCHMTPNKAMFTNYRAIGSLPTVRVADGNNAAIAGIGEVMLVTRVNGRLCTRHVLNVVHVPDLQQNLFSVTSLRRDSGKQLYMDMLGDNCDVMVIRRDGSEYCFAEADLSDGLPWIRASDPEAPDHSPAPASRALPCSVDASSAASVPVEAVTSPALGSSVAPVPPVSDAAVLWHRRMGRVGYDNLAKLIKSGLVTGVPVSAGDFKSATGGPACTPVSSPSMLGHPFHPVIASVQLFLSWFIWIYVVHIRKHLWVVQSMLLHFWLIIPSCLL
jgi:hypothetical protein